MRTKLVATGLAGLAGLVGLAVFAGLLAPRVAESHTSVASRPLPPAPGSVPLRSRVRHYVVRGGITPRFAAPSRYDATQLAGLAATLAPFATELWSCTRRRGEALDPAVAAVVPEVFRGSCFYEGFETITVATTDAATGFARLHGGGFVPSASVERRRVATQFHGALITSGRIPTIIAREGDSVVFDDAASALPAMRPVLAPPEAFLATVRADERWVYVDRDGQALVAFAGRTPVMATLVSTGRRRGATSLGEYRIVRKVPIGTMRDYDPGRGSAPYYIAGVPDTQYFHAGQAFHGVFWHDRFGTRASHGCVNLALADAQWLFDFTDPIPPASETRGRPPGARTVAPAPWPQGREGYGSRVFIHGLLH